MTIRFKVDENLPLEVAALLADAGYSADTVPDEGLGGRPDPTIADICRKEDRAIITLDLDFSDIRAYPPAAYHGIVVLRLARLDKTKILRAVSNLVPLLSQEELVGKLWIADEVSIRVRG